MAEDEEVVVSLEDEARELFDQYKEEDSENIHVFKIREALKEKGITLSKYYEEIEDNRDEAKDGISFDEFLTIYKAAKGDKEKLEEFMSYLKVFDENDSGYLEEEEIIAIVTGKKGGDEALSKEDTNEILAGMQKADTDGDDKISIEELARHILGIPNDDQNADDQNNDEQNADEQDADEQNAEDE